MNEMKLMPTCRYGHGNLDARNSIWSLTGVELNEMTTESDTEQPTVAVLANGRAYSVKIYRCQACGYIELFDDVTDNE